MNSENYKITIEQYGRKYAIESDKPDIGSDELYDMLKSLLLCAGWHETTLKEVFNEDTPS